jgi:hypothetical protein
MAKLIYCMMNIAEITLQFCTSDICVCVDCVLQSLWLGEMVDLKEEIICTKFCVNLEQTGSHTYEMP